MKLIFSVTIALFVALCDAVSASNIADTVFYVKDTAVVYGEKKQLSSLPAYKPRITFSKITAERIGGDKLSDIISLSPGVYVKDYGGYGGLKSVSIRGADAKQTAVFLDGMKLNSNRSGSVDLSGMQSGMIDGIEIIRGGASSESGGGALGGAISIGTVYPQIKSLSVKTSIGSFGEYVAGFSASLPGSASGLCLTGEYAKSKGDYPFDTYSSGIKSETKRTNGGFENASAYLKYVGGRPDNCLTYSTLIRYTDRGVPGAVTDGMPENKTANLKDQEILITASRKIKSDKYRLFAGLSGRLVGTTYNDTQGFDESAKYTDRDFNIRLKGELPGDSYEIFSELEAFFSDLRGNNLNKNVGSYVRRSGVDLTLGSKFNISVGDYVGIAPGTTLKFESVSDVMPAFSPSVGSVISFGGLPLVLRCEYSGNYRIPTFNEMYYLNYGTSDLKPEKSLSADIGLTLFPASGLELSADIFRTDTRDRIIAVQKSAIAWSAKNLSKTESKGLEIGATLKAFDDRLLAGLSYTYSQSVDKSENSDTYNKRLIYTPDEIVSAYASYSDGTNTISANVLHSSYRYSSADNSSASVLKSYSTASIRVERKIKLTGFTISPGFSIDNIFDERFEIIKCYPMPGRSLRFTVKIGDFFADQER